MKKQHIINLIKYHTEGSDIQFHNESAQIARVFNDLGDYQLSEYIMQLIADPNLITSQPKTIEHEFFKQVTVTTQSLPLPQVITSDIQGMVNAVNHSVGIHKFLFEGPPGTGKTETAKTVADLLDRQLLVVAFSQLVDSKMGETAKNIVAVFKALNELPNPQNYVVLFDEIDIIALDRVRSNDVREMGRVTSTLLKELDQFHEDLVLIATTNLFEHFDKALLRRFDAVIDFSRYSKEDLIEISEIILNRQLEVFTFAARDVRLFRKIISCYDVLPSPGELNNLIKISLAFSDSHDAYDYFRILLSKVLHSSKVFCSKTLKDLGFTDKEIHILTGTIYQS